MSDSSTNFAAPDDAFFRWLHFSDLHVGMAGQDSLWPRFQHLLLDDIGPIIERTGEVDLLIFSGDLVQKGAASEFDHFDEVIERVRSKFSLFQSLPPKLLTVPGNHDLVRPDSYAPETIAVKQFWSNEELRRVIWSKENDRYRSFLSSIFKNYAVWRSRAITRGVHLAPESDGLLPGDATYCIKTSGGKLGVVTLNSSWLQLSGSDYKGELHVDVQQLLAVTGSDPDGWAAGNDANLLVTHHPSSWLKSAGMSRWESDIDPPNRFDAHLFGHMHEPSTVSVAHGGSSQRRTIQAASLFGLEKYGDDHIRTQGYSANRLRVTLESRELTSWPRRLIAISGGSHKIAPDSSQDIDENTSSFTLRYPIRNSGAGSKDLEHVGRPTSLRSELSQASPIDISALRLSLGDDRAHIKVRRVEQERFIHALRLKRIAWLAAEWGMGIYGFISAIRRKMDVPSESIFRIDFSEYQDRELFFEDIQQKIGTSFEKICNAIADSGLSFVLLDGVGGDIVNDQSLVEDIESLAKAVSDFAPDAFVILGAERAPRNSQHESIELKALDEADLATYVRESGAGDDRYSKPETASKIFRHTDGVPSRVDAALLDLEILSIDELIGSNPDFSPAVSVEVAPAALSAAIAELASSENKQERRSYDLLLALAALPRGEQLTRLKRLLGAHPIGPVHARALLERSLIDTANLAPLGNMATESTAKLLFVPKLVREYVMGSIEEDAAKVIDRKTIELYFGTSWALGDIGSSPTGRRVKEALCDPYEIQNASTIIVRSVSRALSDDDRPALSKLLRLAIAFANLLLIGDHYRSAASVCEDLFLLLKDTSGIESEINALRYTAARSLRMIGRHQEARKAFDYLDMTLLDRDSRQHAELCLALTLKALEDDDAAQKVASRAISRNRNSGQALHAQAIIASYIEDPDERFKENQRLLRLAEKKKSQVVANNLRIDLARDARDLGKPYADFLKEVVSSKNGESDSYNAYRAVIDLAEAESRLGEVSERNKMLLIEAYHFLHNERMLNLFDRCHRALWQIFEREKDRANLLAMFRHSSFIWRLNGREDKEAEYLRRISENVADLVELGVSMTGRDGAYLVVRITVVLGGVN